VARDRRGQFLARRQALLCELQVGEAADGSQPFAWFGFLCRLGQRRLQSLDRVRRFEALDERARRLRRTHEVCVIVDQARDHGAAAEIDDLNARLFAVERHANREEAAIADAYCGDGAVRGIDGEDIAVGQDQVPAAGARVGGMGCGCQENRQQNKKRGGYAAG
jgi:hypothetical protein